MRKAPARCALMAKARGREPHVRVRVTQERVGEGPRAGPGVDDEAHQSPQIHLGAGTRARSRIQLVLIRYESSGHVLQQPSVL